MALCGSKTRSGEPCKRHAVPGSRRCKLHGGKSSGPKDQRGNTNAASPGSIYSKYLTDDENALLPSIELGQVDDELRLTRIRLMRALAREGEQGDTAELTERIERDGAENVTARLEERYKVRDYAALIDRLTARVESLELRRSVLQQQQLDAELKRLDAEKLRLELRDKGAGKDDGPVSKIVIEVVGSQNARNPDDNDGAAGEVLPAT